MSALENQRPAAASASGPEGRLDSWKEIAVYLGRGVRTVQRWEREEGLPVHRLAHEKRGTVYAHRHEVDTWWESRRLVLSAEASDEAPAAAVPPSLDRITWTSTATFWPALSSDGRFLAYVSDGGRDGTLPQIWLQQIGGGATCLTSDARARSHLAFTAGDTLLVFVATDETGQHVYAMPTLGGEPRLLKRGVRAARPSPDGKWLAYVSFDQPAGIRIAALDGTGERTIAVNLIDVGFVIWSPDSKHVLVQAHAEPTIEPDYWIAAIDGSTPRDTGILQRLRVRGNYPLTLPAAWTGDSLVFSQITSSGVGLWRQRLAAATLEPKGDAEALTRGFEFDCFPTASAGRVAFVNTHPDQNLWSLAIDPSTGVSHGALRRLTRGPGYISYLSVSRDGRTLCYFLARRTGAGPVLRDLEADTEAPFALATGDGYPAVSPSGSQIAWGARPPGPRVVRPILVSTVADGEARKLGDDCGGRPCQWLDERFLLIERFGLRLHSIAVLDATNGEQRDLLSSAEHSITNPRVSPDGQWIAFDAVRGGAPPWVYVAPLRTGEPVRQGDWIVVERSASHPFWSADGRLLYYLPTIPITEFRNVIRARRFEAASHAQLGEPFTAFMSSEMVVPASIAGATPVATHDRIILVLGDFRGDVWKVDV